MMLLQCNGLSKTDPLSQDSLTNYQGQTSAGISSGGDVGVTFLIPGKATGTPTCNPRWGDSRTREAWRAVAVQSESD